MKNLYILQDINEEKLSKLKEENADFIAFDYVSHEILAKNKIKHNLIDDYINENDRKEIFQFCSTCLKQYERYCFSYSLISFCFALRFALTY